MWGTFLLKIWARQAAGRAIMRRPAQFLGITGLCDAAFDPIFCETGGRSSDGGTHQGL